MPVVVSDTSPLIYLSWVGQLDLLRRLYGVVLVPGAVWAEMNRGGNATTGASEVRAAIEGDWIRVAAVEPSLRVLELAADRIDPGELEAIALAASHHAILIIDDLDGRRVARLLGVEMTGTLGVLARAKREHQLAAIRPLLLRLMQETNFRLSRHLVDAVLADAGEPPL